MKIECVYSFGKIDTTYLKYIIDSFEFTKDLLNERYQPVEINFVMKDTDNVFIDFYNPFFPKFRFIRYEYFPGPNELMQQLDLFLTPSNCLCGHKSDDTILLEQSSEDDFEVFREEKEDEDHTKESTETKEEKESTDHKEEKEITETKEKESTKENEDSKTLVDQPVATSPPPPEQTVTTSSTSSWW